MCQSVDELNGAATESVYKRLARNAPANRRYHRDGVAIGCLLYEWC